MSVYLYRWGRFAFRRKWLVIPLWVGLLVVLGVLGTSLHKPYQDSFTMPGLASQRATDILDKHFPGMSASFDPNVVSGTYVVAAPAGQRLTDPANAAALQELLVKLGTLPIVDQQAPITNPVDATAKAGTASGVACLTGDRHTPQFAAACSGAPLNVLNKTNPDSVAVVHVKFTIPKFSDITAADRTAAYTVADPARQAGLRVELSGPIAQEQFGEGSSEAVGVLVALVVMVVAFGAIVAAFIPILTAAFGVGAATFLILTGSSVVTLPTFTPILATMIGLALSIDYALFIVSRYKHELTSAESPEEAAGVAVGTAGTAVVFAGLTVVIALLGLSVVGVGFLTYMGIGGALAAAFAVLIALTLIPAVLGAFGRFLFRPRIPFVARHDPDDDSSVTNGMRFAKLIARAPAATLVLAVLALGLLALPAAGIHLGLPGGESAPAKSTIHKAYQLQTNGFGEGSNGTLMIAVDMDNVPQNLRTPALDDLRGQLASYPGVQYLTAVQSSKDGNAALFNAVPVSGPNNQQTADLVQRARAAEPALKTKYGLEYGITGTTAIYADVNQVLLSKIVPYLALVAAAAFLLLMVVFRSILVPLTAALGFLLSMAATFGATVLIFQEDKLGLVGQALPIVSFLPIILIGLVFGLAMDYQVFLVSRMREEFTRGKPPTQAMIAGYRHGARVVTSAAVIMISVFASFLLNGEIMVASMGFALAAGVLLDAFLVRMMLIPALLTVLGKWAWWLPKWLDRILPQVDVEGTRLRELRQRHRKATREREPVAIG